MATSNRPWARWVWQLQVLLIVVMMAGMLSHKFSLLPFRPAFMAFYYAIQAVVVLWVVALVLLVICAWLRKKPQLKSLFASLALGALPVLAVLATVGKGLGVPAIHNISTDLEQPPEFVAAYAQQVERLNSLDSPAAEVRAQQRAYYKDLAPLELATGPDQAFDLVLNKVKALGWQLVDSDRSAGRIEAFEETLLFGFKDDVVIRISATDAGSRIDVRSVSRVGRSDLGANAARIQRLFDQLRDHSS